MKQRHAKAETPTPQKKSNDDSTIYASCEAANDALGPCPRALAHSDGGHWWYIDHEADPDDPPASDSASLPAPALSAQVERFPKGGVTGLVGDTRSLYEQMLWELENASGILKNDGYKYSHGRIEVLLEKAKASAQVEGQTDEERLEGWKRIARARADLFVDKTGARLSHLDCDRLEYDILSAISAAFDVSALRAKSEKEQIELGKKEAPSDNVEVLGQKSLSVILDEIDLRYQRSLADPYDPETCEKALRDNPKLVNALRRANEIIFKLNENPCFEEELAKLLSESAGSVPSGNKKDL